MFTGVSRVVPEYESSRMMIYAQMRTGQRVVAVRHYVTVAFLTPFFCVQNVGEILSARWRIPLLWEGFSAFSVKTYIPFLKDAFPGCANWFRRTEAENDDIRIVFCACGIPPRNLSAIPECLRNVHHLYQFPDYLVAVALAMPLEASRLTLAMISSRKCSWAAV